MKKQTERKAKIQVTIKLPIEARQKLMTMAAAAGYTTVGRYCSDMLVAMAATLAEPPGVVRNRSGSPGIPAA